MINVYIYLDSQEDARELTYNLIDKGLFAHASIDKDNHSIQKTGDKITEQTYFVITGQTKALLFNSILYHVKQQGIENAKIYSVPITQCNETFGEMIRNNTLKI